MHFAKKSLICKHCTLSCTNLWPLAFHHSVSTMCQSKLFIFCLLFALLAKSIRKTRCWQQSTMCVQTSTVCVCVSDKDWKAQRNVLIDFQLKQNEHNEQHTLLLHCMLAIFDSCYDAELFPSAEMLINPFSCSSAEVLLGYLDVLG